MRLAFRVRAVIALCGLLGFGLIGCGDSSSGGGGGNGEGATLGFVFSDFGFYFPADRQSSVAGFDIDGHTSSSGNPVAGECAHDDFSGPGGAQGIDYQFLYAIDELPGLQENQIVDGVISASVISGEMTIVMEVTGVDDRQNDDEVMVQIASSLDKPPTGGGVVIPGGTLQKHPDARFRSAAVVGRIEDGILMAGPVDLRFDFNIQIVDSEMSITKTLLRVDLNGETISGVFGGLWSVAEIREIIGIPTTENGNAGGFDRAKFEETMLLADSAYNEDTQVCDAFTTTFRFDAVDAFIVE